MRLAHRKLRLRSSNTVEVEFLDMSTDTDVIAEFHFVLSDGSVRVTGSEPDVLQWCEGSAEDVRRVNRAIASFVEAARPDLE